MTIFRWLAVVSLWLAMTASVSAQTLTFEEFDTTFTPKYVTNGYGQIRWTNWIVLNQSLLIPPNGLASGVVSGANAVTNTRANPSIFSGHPFTLRSAWITARVPELSLSVIGSVGTSRVVTNTFRVFGQPTLVHFQMENVTSVDFIASIGIIAVDDVRVEVPQRAAASPQFAPGGILFTPSKAVSVAIGDINGDALNDLVIAAANSVRVDLGSPAGGFLQQPQARIADDFLILSDYDQDGIKDALIGTTVLRYRNPNTYDTSLTVFGGGSPQAIGDFYEDRRVVHADTISSDLITGDFNADSRLDYIQLNQSQPRVEFFRNTGSGFERFQIPLPPAAWGTVGNALAFDFDEDNDLDLAIAVEGAAEICLLFNDGSGAFPTSQMVNVGVLDPKALALADFDGDGRQDLAVRGAFSSVSLLRNLGPRAFSAPEILAPGGSIMPSPLTSRSLAAGDLNQDGAPDLAFVSGMEVMTLLNQTLPRFRIERVVDVVQVRWNFGGGWILQTSFNLQDWQPADATPVESPDGSYIFDTGRDSAKFFRLRRPD